MSTSRLAAIALATTVLATPAGAQDALSKVIAEQFKMHEGNTLCAPPGASLEDLRASVADQLRPLAGRPVTVRDVAIATWVRFPCPFSPFRHELRPATAKDIEGVWLFPESSQKYRYPPRSDRQPPTGLVPVKCDAVAYYPGGELRHAVFGGQLECPFSKAAHMDVSRRNPVVSRWAMVDEGRVGATRTDVANHIEEWDVFIVVVAFEVQDLRLQVGDLVAYVRRENGNEVNAATQFRHLKKLQ